MTRDEALQAMIDGYLVTHRLFSADEYIYMIAQDIYMEDDVNVGTVNDDFWMNRGGKLGGEMWLDDWEVLNKSK